MYQMSSIISENTNYVIMKELKHKQKMILEATAARKTNGGFAHIKSAYKHKTTISKG